MARKIYKRLGLRRDKNFGDLSDARLSLNNLLDGLVDTVGNTFVSDDLNAIRNINNIGLSNSQYLKVVGSTTKYTPSGGGNNLSFKPHITYQNRIDQFTVFSGVPRISGGNGPTSRYWQKDQILVNRENASEGKQFEYWQNTNSTASEVLAGVTTMGQLPTDTQWEKGDFDYSGKLHPSSVLTDGGVTWEGYFVATRTGPHTFTNTTTGYTTYDFNLEGYEEDNDKVQTATSISAVGAGNTYKEWNRIGITTTFNGNSASADSNELTIKADFSKTIGVGMSVSGTGLVSGTGGNGETIWPTVEEYSNPINGSTSTVTLKPIPGQTYAVGGSALSNATLTFFRNLGQNVSVNFTTQYLIEFRRYRWRARFFFPKDVNTNYLQRKINFDFSMPGSSATDLYYYKLFDLNYTFTEDKKGGFNRFFDAAVRFGGTDPIGIGGTLAESGKPNPFVDNNPYVKVKTSDKIQAKYSPKTTLAGIEKRSQECTGTSGGTVLTCDNTGGIEIGNYVFGPNTDDSTNLVAEGTRVIDIVINQILIINKPCQIDATQTLKFIDHRGFVKRVKGAATTSGGTTVDFASGYTTDDTDKWKESLKKGMLVLTTKQGGGDVNNYTRITSINDSNTITLSNGMSNSANTPIYIYQSRGLVDNSLVTFCPQTGSATTRCHLLPVQFNGSDYIAAAGQNVIQLVSVSNLSTGLVVEGFGIPVGTTIDSVSGSSILLTADLTKSINGGATVTIHPASLTGDRQLCCPPTDTSPPFEATPNGLMTPNAKRNLSFSQGNIQFDELRFKFPNNQSGKIAAFGTSETVDRKIHIKTGAVQDQQNGLFYLLGSTT